MNKMSVYMILNKKMLFSFKVISNFIANFTLDSGNAVTLKWQLYSSNNAEKFIEILKEFYKFVMQYIFFN